MWLSSFSYKTAGWELTEMDALRTTNLLVGRNASGKTRTIKALQGVTNFLQMKGSALGEYEFKTRLTFADAAKAGWEMVYSFETADGKVVSEQMAVNGETLIKRNAEKTIFMGQTINPPTEKLVVQVRRDKEAYPEVESLMEWAEGAILISCSDINPYTVILGNAAPIVNPVPFSSMVDALTAADKKNVIAVAKRLGYGIKEISTFEVNGKMKFVTVKELYVKRNIMDYQLSSGMMRVLYILCFLEYMGHGAKHSLLLIDDLGEGLDYNRATLLGKLVFERCEEEHIQLIASSNDSFMMDVVDISKWQIVRRDKNKLKVLNQSNTSGLFDSFRMTGLSNFDLFSSDYIDDYLAQVTK